MPRGGDVMLAHRVGYAEDRLHDASLDQWGYRLSPTLTNSARTVRTATACQTIVAETDSDSRSESPLKKEANPGRRGTSWLVGTRRLVAGCRHVQAR